jgi:hypothetical protein
MCQYRQISRYRRNLLAKTFGDIGVPPPVIDFTMLFSCVEQVKNPENQINIEGAPALLMFLVL